MKIAFVSRENEWRGVEYISEVLKQAGHQVELFIDPQLFSDGFIYYKKLSNFFNSQDQLIKDLKHYNPDLIGMSIISGAYSWAVNITKRIKQEMSIPIIVGGIHIGNSALIAPGAYVNFDVPENAVVLGNPGKIVSSKGSDGYVTKILDHSTNNN